MSVASTGKFVRGGSWLLGAGDAGTVFTPEQMSEEHRLIGQTAAEFVNTEVLPVLDQLETKDWPLNRVLVRKCGDLGLFGADIPDAYGGVGLDKVASLVVSERIARSASFATTFGAQVNLCALAIYLFGNESQKQQYLPKLMTGEIVGAYALSESGSGSDALGAKARATRQPDGSFLLNGEKMWITNGGFADVIVVFAKVDGEVFTAFIVERAFPGVSSGKEEHKMGLHGSSTTPIILQDARVPAENVLGEVGKGHKVAFNVLNFGRFKLSGMCSGGATMAIEESAKYAGTRKQFGQTIGSFGAIRHKLGEMIARAYAVDALNYRTAGLIDTHVAATPHDPNDGAAAVAALEEYAIEASVAKVAGSEMLDYVLDENLQIHGGNGFVKDYPPERHYRDARVNRIFEGTNEINRLLIPGMLARRAFKGDLGIIPAAKALQEELLGPPEMPEADDRVLADERRALDGFRKVGLMVLGLAMQTYREKLATEQEVLMHTADILIDLYSADSAVLRAISAVEAGVQKSSLHVDAARVFVNDAAMRIEASAKQALAIMAEGDVLRMALSGLRRLLKVTPQNTAVMRRRLADEAVARGNYIF